ncbi:GGDEF domain-containing protein [Micromonospora sp. SH-82]|uniref:GGDEF domain-containing protein n=1 Tax=Micromonospora sp. SH-82 TaxID=3132938 RepID=UPI003EBC4F91
MHTAILATLLGTTTASCLALLAHTSRLRAKLAHARHEANHDPLTGLPNRRALRHHLDTLLSDTTRPISVAMLDLDTFKRINDTHGHAVGDRVLRRVAAALAALDLPGAYLGRLSGDEFLIITDGGTQAGHRNARRAAATLDATTVTVAGQTIRCRASIGTATANPRDCRPEELLGRADAAMYAAKRHGPGVQEWHQGLDQNTGTPHANRRRRFR